MLFTMKPNYTLALTLCVLLVPLVHCQWTPMRSYSVQRRFQFDAFKPTTPVTVNFASRFDGSPSTSAPVARPTPSRTSPPAPYTPGPSVPTVKPENDLKIATTVVDFMMRISRTLAQAHSKTELFSPVSIATVANLLFLGSKGTTHEEFSKVLTPPGMNWKKYHQRYSGVLQNMLSKTPNDTKRDPWRRQTCPVDDDYEDEESGPQPMSQEIRVASGIFYQPSLRMKQNYVTIARGFYNALVDPIDPQNPATSAAKINRWVSDVTAGKIPNMLDGPLSPSSSVVIVNALYFKGKWKTPFEPFVTRPAPFFPNGYDGPSYRVPIMSLSGCLPFHKTRNGVSIVGLPYRDDTSTMYLIQPTNSSYNAIRRLQAGLSAKVLESWISQMKLQSTLVRLPKMHLKSSIDLLQSFQKLGFTSILSPAKSDLSNMIDEGSKQRPYVNQIMHKVDLTIDEEGTEGAAATSALVDRIGSQQTFNGNAPFLIFLRHDATELPLFYGPVFDPRS